MVEETNAPELSIIMPCLNEAETLAVCLQKALHGIENAGCRGEVVVADNGSTDGSQEIARSLGARVIPVEAKGYGNALRGGIGAARGRFIIMGDADDSYDFSRIEPFLARLRAGADLVMGCRMPRGGGTIMPGAMPWKHRWIGNPALSFVGRLFFKSPITDFHCGLRGFSRSAYDRMDLQTSGMEFASEMVIKATLLGMKMDEVPITLFKDGRSRPPHLRSWRDGWRHLRFMMLYSPRWLFLYPGFALMISGLVVGGYLVPQARTLFGVTFDIHTLLLASAAIQIGFQAICFALFTKIFATMEKLLPPDPKFESAFTYINLEKGLAVGILMLLAGLGLSLLAVFKWSDVSFGPLEPSLILRILIPGTTLLMLGFSDDLGQLLLQHPWAQAQMKTPGNESPVSFDDYAAKYDESLNRALAITGENKYYYASERIRRLGEILLRRKHPVDRILDFGCGTGTAARLLRDLLGAKRIVGGGPVRRVSPGGTTGAWGESIFVYRVQGLLSAGEF